MSPDQLDPAAPLTLRPAPRLRSIARRVARLLELRNRIEVEVGTPPPPELVEAVPAGHVGISESDEGLTIALGGPRGHLYSTTIELPDERDAALRAIALTIEALRDSAIEGPPAATIANAQPPPPPGRTVVREHVRFVYLEPEGGFFGRQRPHEPEARPAIQVRFLLGVTTDQNLVLLGPGVGLGLCVGIACVVLEGDLPVFASERRSQLGAIARYRPVNLAMRAQLRPFRWGDVVPALTAGALVRFGVAWADAPPGGQSSRATVTSFGVRGTGELAWVFFAPFEVVLEGGVDVVATPASLMVGPETVSLDDPVTVWAMLSLRMRP